MRVSRASLPCTCSSPIAGGAASPARAEAVAELDHLLALDDQRSSRSRRRTVASTWRSTSCWPSRLATLSRVGASRGGAAPATGAGCVCSDPLSRAASKRSARAPVHRSSSEATRRRVTASVRIQVRATPARRRMLSFSGPLEPRCCNAADPCIAPRDADYCILRTVRSSTGSGPRRRSALLLSVGMQWRARAQAGHASSSRRRLLPITAPGCERSSAPGRRRDAYATEGGARGDRR